MANPLFNRFGGGNNVQPQNNIISQFLRLQKNPGEILDVLLQSGKINQQQYNELQPYKNNPEMIGKYLMDNGNSNSINQIQQMLNQSGFKRSNN